MTPRQRATKRIMDIVLSAAGLVVLSPVMLVVALLVRLTSPGPAIHHHVRVGRHSVLFKTLKFRSMWHTPGIEGPEVTIAGDPRITPLGRRLRRSKLDEIRQLWNVLRGEMSLVGPRPDILGYADQLEGRCSRLLELRPGITGPATLYFRDEGELLPSIPESLAYDDDVIYPLKVLINLEYLHRWTLARDLGYLVVTGDSDPRSMAPAHATRERRGEADLAASELAPVHVPYTFGALRHTHAISCSMVTIPPPARSKTVKPAR
jgi:lipopolysaccharide/colanic/teichoic acid biosynthesis glycosyltransferase